jgi:hypothetical protein
MDNDECLDEHDLMMAKGIVSMYRAVWNEAERQFPSFSVEERFKLCSLISPLINNMISAAFDADIIEALENPSVKPKKKK